MPIADGPEGAHNGGVSDPKRGRFRFLSGPYVPATDAQGVSHSRIQPYRPLRDACRLCPGRCCSTTVKLSLVDALVFCETLQLPLFAMLGIDQSAELPRSFALERDDRVSDPEDGWLGFGVLRLARREGGRCVGLMNVGGYERCSVYSARPSNCRLYPMAFEDEDGDRTGPTAILCPAPFAVPPEVAEVGERVVEEAQRNWTLHEEVIAEWNGAEVEDRSLERAMQFLFERTAERLGRPLDPVVLAEGSAVERLQDELVERGLMFQGRAGGPRGFAGLPPKAAS